MITTKPNTSQSPVYTYLSHTPSPSDAPKTIPVQQPSSSLNIFAPKPFRSPISINHDIENNSEPVRILYFLL
jgi:hypothetical protein